MLHVKFWKLCKNTGVTNHNKQKIVKTENRRTQNLQLKMQKEQQKFWSV